MQKEIYAHIASTDMAPKPTSKAAILAMRIPSPVVCAKLASALPLVPWQLLSPPVSSRGNTSITATYRNVPAAKADSAEPPAPLETCKSKVQKTDTMESATGQQKEFVCTKSAVTG
jgi:hypothetical protein